MLINRNFIFFMLILRDLVINHVECKIVKLYDKIHFYEFQVDLEDSNLNVKYQQPFNFMIESEESEYVNNSAHFDDDNRFKLDADVLIYSNHQQTLSFLLEITFSTLKKSHFKVRGYELVFQQKIDDFKNSRIRIILDDQHNLESYIKSYKFRIKDPSFLSMNENYSFYFGSVFVRQLVEFKNSTLASWNEFRSKTVELGIRANGQANLKTLDVDPADLCVGHLIHRTCVIRYQNKASNYYIVMHPLSNEFERLAARMNIKENSSTFYSYPAEKFANGLVIKFVRFSSEYIQYENEFEKTSNSSPCKHYEKYCECPIKCVSCETEIKVKYLAFSHVSKTKTNLCENDFFKSYTFDNVKMESNFQNVQISNSTELTSRGTLPRICLQLRKKSSENYDLNIMFYDYHLIGQTKLIDVDYLLKIYFISYVSANRSAIRTELIRDINQKINLNEPLSVENLNKGTYLIELIPKEKSSFCKEDECIEEGLSKNQVVCKKCNKLIVLFNIDQNINYEITKPINLFERSTGMISILPNSIRIYNRSQTSLLFDKIISKTVNKNLEATSNQALFRNYFYETIATSSFNANDIVYPNYFHDYIINTITYQNDNEKTQMFMSLAVLILILLIFLITFCLCVISTITSGIVSFNRKLVIFYLSVFISKNDQKMLSEFMLKYTKALKKKFLYLDIVKVDYNSEEKVDFEWLDKADLIVYVCGTKKETNHLDKGMFFGINNHHHDFNKIHFDKKYKDKTIDILFDKKKTKSSTLIVNMDAKLEEDNSNFSLFELSKQNNESKSSKGTSFLKSKKYFQIPNETSLFVQKLSENTLKSEEYFYLKKMIIKFIQSVLTKSISRILNQIHKQERSMNKRLFKFAYIDFLEQPKCELVENGADCTNLIVNYSSN